ncbi:T9SS type A sorting domain-containing protein [Mariniflexile sp. HMF6888]|uniref:T9SS type A sorting domain-containing protein n=1 Tax=Mariniflexile sp. HMF6888 TaxID=3373086 RepID=UPI0037885B1F
MIKKITLLSAFFILSAVTAQTNFGWETAEVSLITETISGITTTVTMVGSGDSGIVDIGESSGNIATSSIKPPGTPISTAIFNFSEPININSIVALEGVGADIDYTFTPSGGTNPIVVASLVNGVASVNLNWTDVTSFTVTSSGSIFGFDDLLINGVTNFGWETADVSVITETINGITTTVTMVESNDSRVIDASGFGGASNNVIVSSNTPPRTLISTVIFNFSETVIINSILALETTGADIDYTFTPSGGTNPIVVASLVNGVASVNLNWTDVTSFTVTSSGSIFGFDNLLINDSSLSDTNYFSENSIIYPNPVQDFLYLETIKNLKFTKIYNNLGQLIIETKDNKIDFSNLNTGVYFLQLITDKRLINKRIIKK